MSAETFLSQAAGSVRDYATETLHFYFTAISQITWVVQYDGWISGWMSSRDTGFGVAINADVPSALITAVGVTPGLVLPPANVAMLAAQIQPGNVRIPFKISDKINVRCFNAAASAMNLFLSHWV